MAITSRKDIKMGMLVVIREKETNEEVRGYVTEIITKNNSKKGIQVRLKSGKVGRVIEIPDVDQIKSEQFKFLNKFLYLKEIYSIWDNDNRRYVVFKTNNENTSVLFTSKENALRFIEEKNLRSKIKNISVTQLNRRRLIVDNFKTLNVKYFMIDRKLKISEEDLRKKEIHFNNL